MRKCASIRVYQRDKQGPGAFSKLKQSYGVEREREEVYTKAG